MEKSGIKGVEEKEMKGQNFFEAKNSSETNGRIPLLYSTFLLQPEAVIWIIRVSKNWKQDLQAVAPKLFYESRMKTLSYNGMSE